MTSTWYLTSEQLSYKNYPVLSNIIDDVNKIIAYAKSTNSAMTAYYSGTYNKIDVNIIELNNYIELCRTVCAAISNSSAVCYDLLLDIREIQATLQELWYAKNRYGDQYVGTPTDSTADSDTI